MLCLKDSILPRCRVLSPGQASTKQFERTGPAIIQVCYNASGISSTHMHPAAVQFCHHFGRKAQWLHEQPSLMCVALVAVASGGVAVHRSDDVEQLQSLNVVFRAASRLALCLQHAFDADANVMLIPSGLRWYKPCCDARSLRSRHKFTAADMQRASSTDVSSYGDVPPQ